MLVILLAGFQVLPERGQLVRLGRRQEIKMVQLGINAALQVLIQLVYLRFQVVYLRRKE